MDDATQRRWDITLKVIGLVGLIFSAGWTYYKYRDDRRVDLQHQQEEQSREQQARKSELNSFIFQRQATLYFEASAAAATIATSTDQNEVEKAKNKFNELYFGELVVVEDRRVEMPMISFE